MTARREGSAPSPRGEGIDWEVLLAQANRARGHAWAPYSGYQVGAAILSPSGQVYAGCNVENASFGLTVCAERNAVGQMIAAGERALAAIAIVTLGPEPGTPCGLCRQTLAEFVEDAPVALAVAGESTPRQVTSLAALFPSPFRADLARR